MKKHIPNAISIISALAAPLVTYWALIQEWDKAFVLLAVLVASDMIDGWSAQVLNAHSQIGKDWIDPISDAIKSAAAMSGLVFQAQGSADFWLWAFPMLAIGIPMKVLKHQYRCENLRLLANSLLPFCYIGVVTVVLNIYAIKAIGWDPVIGIMITIPCLLLAGKIKSHRTAAWTSGKR